MTEYEKLIKCVNTVKKTIDFKPKIGLILGSGLGSFASEIDVCGYINYSDIPSFPVSTISGHAGRFVFGYVGTVPIVAMQGRVHFYEGYSMADVVMPTRIMGLLGAEILFVTNAAGGVNPAFAAGDLMLIRDQISFFVPSPLIGENIEKLGTRFPDMSEIYSAKLCETIIGTANKLDIKIQEGTYLQLTGPAYESPAEIRAISALGADAVGMSTACEAIAAKHMGLSVCGLSLISNMAAGINPHPLSHEEVKAAAEKAAPSFCSLIKNSVINIGKEI